MKNKKRLLSGPYLFWAVAFIIIPSIMIFYYGLTDDNYQFTLMNLAEITTPENLKALGLSLLLSFISTVICLILAYPLAMILSQKNTNQSSFIVLIFILPMWMNFLLRTLAWQTLLEKNGVINGVLSFLHLPTLDIINTPLYLVWFITFCHLWYCRFLMCWRRLTKTSSTPQEIWVQITFRCSLKSSFHFLCRV